MGSDGGCVRLSDIPGHDSMPARQRGLRGSIGPGCAAASPLGTRERAICGAPDAGVLMAGLQHPHRGREDGMQKRIGGGTEAGMCASLLLLGRLGKRGQRAGHAPSSRENETRKRKLQKTDMGPYGYTSYHLLNAKLAAANRRQIFSRLRGMR
ncbi:hypothetical protein DENSPDRAFT_664864 [Dentipellis sp. KUC8613]|nr:hypothetical protein DENSPDRAFT_664864 [Dentipellis sp. KUC8613]